MKIIPFPQREIEEGSKMCTILKSLEGLSAEELVRNANLENSVPIDLNKLLDHYQILSSGYDFSDIEKTLHRSKGDIYGAVFSTDEDVCIFYSENDDPSVQRFTIAHELAHCCLDTQTVKETHLEYRMESTKDREKEIRMNVFAANLLMPEKKVLEVISAVSHPTIGYLASIFQVPYAAMKKRLMYLDLI